MAKSISPAGFRSKLLAWFRAHRRAMPWRAVRSPYRTWISEMMLQQTQVKTVIPYFERWMKEFPTLEKLAAADEHRVLAMWQGLGYYSRARQIKKAAEFLVNERGGRIPDTPEGIAEVPGIGPYSAGAILSIAYGRRTPAVDGNVMRVFARLYELREPVLSPAMRNTVRDRVLELMPAKDTGDFTEALMELGATVCVPRSPDCGVCPVRPHCRARALGVAHELPVKKPRPALTKVRACAVVVRRGALYLLRKRPVGRIMGGLWEFPEWKLPSDETGDAPGAEQRLAARMTGMKTRQLRHRHTIKRHYTRFAEDLAVFEIEWNGCPIPNPEGWEEVWLDSRALPEYPLTSAHAKIRRLVLEVSDKSGSAPLRTRRAR